LVTALTVGQERDRPLLAPTPRGRARLARGQPRFSLVQVLFGHRHLRRRCDLVFAYFPMAITHYPRIDRRLLLLLWHLADRWGRVTPDGVRIPMRLTHTLLADLVAARRPSVTTAFAQLEDEGHLSRHDNIIVLHGEAPADFDVVASPSHEA
jgi:hypothetical protein